jgi:hypothetical protein
MLYMGRAIERYRPLQVLSKYIQNTQGKICISFSCSLHRRHHPFLRLSLYLSVSKLPIEAKLTQILSIKLHRSE